MKKLYISDHPLVLSKISMLRNKNTDSKLFRELIHECALLLGYEATRNILTLKSIPNMEGPLATFTGYEISDKIAIIPILRAGLGLVDALLTLLPSAAVVHLGIFREKITLQPVEYYNKLPKNMAYDVCIVVDPMIATGGTTIAALNLLKDSGQKNIKLMAICASKQGIELVQDNHPDVEIICGVMDSELNDHGYILPGLGDAGDRLYKTI